MTPKRTTGITVFAILNLVFGGLGLLCGVCSGASLAMNSTVQKMQAQQSPQGDDLQKIQREFEAKIPGYVPVQWTQLALSLILNSVLVFSGIALLRMNPMGRWAAIGYSVVEILVSIGSLIYNLVYVGPAMDEMFNQMQKQAKGPQLPQGFMSTMVSGGTILVVGLSIAFATALLIFMLLPATARAFASRGGPDFGGPEDDYYDPDFQRPRRDNPPES